MFSPRHNLFSIGSYFNMTTNIGQKNEEILETIWCLSEKKRFDSDAIKEACPIEVSDKDLDSLEEQGLIVKRGDRVSFSKQGKEYAEKIIRRCRLTKVLISSILKLKHNEMKEIACQVEHTLQPEVEEAICTLLGHPEVCPDGSPIPPGKNCCGKRSSTVSNIVSSLDELKAGESGKVTFIKPSNHSQLHQILSFGLKPGVKIDVNRTSPAFCIQFENTELALDTEIAKNIFLIKNPKK